MYDINIPPFYENTCSLDELDGNQIIQKFQNLEVLKKKGASLKAKNSFYKRFDKKIIFNGFIMFSFRCKSHVHEILLLKNMFGCPLKLNLGFSGIFYIYSIKPKHSYTIMYECEKSPLTHELSYIGLLIFFH